MTHEAVTTVTPAVESERRRQVEEILAWAEQPVRLDVPGTCRYCGGLAWTADGIGPLHPCCQWWFEHEGKGYLRCVPSVCVRATTEPSHHVSTARTEHLLRKSFRLFRRAHYSTRVASEVLSRCVITPYARRLGARTPSLGSSTVCDDVLDKLTRQARQRVSCDDGAAESTRAEASHERRRRHGPPASVERRQRNGGPAASLQPTRWFRAGEAWEPLFETSGRQRRVLSARPEAGASGPPRHLGAPDVSSGTECALRNVRICPCRRPLFSLLGATPR